MRLILTLLLLSIAAGATAAVYKWKKPDGSIIYSDQPPAEGATPTELPQVQEIKIATPPPSSEEPEEKAAPREQTVSYTKLEITEPENDSNIRDNAGNVSVNLEVEPRLLEGDIASITLDGKEIGQGRGTSIALSNVDRGTHTLQATVKNAQGAVLITSRPVIFHLQRTSILHPNATPSP